MASLGLGVVIEPVFTAFAEPAVSSAGHRIGARRSAPSPFGVGFFVNCYLLIVVGELVPKAIAIRQHAADRACGRPARCTGFIASSIPFIWLLHRSSPAGLAAARHCPRTNCRSAQSEEELRLVLASAQGTAVGRNMILNALDLRHRIAREVMRPRHEITAFDTERDDGRMSRARGKDALLALSALRGRRSGQDARRRPHQGPLRLRDKARTAADLLPVARTLIYVPETARLEKLLQLFLERKLHFAVVVDEYGGTLGIVTLENVLEALVGQIQDEFDQEKSELTRRRRKYLGSRRHAAVARTGKNHRRNVQHDESVATASGWVTQKLGGFPKAGDVADGGRLRIARGGNGRPARGAAENHQTRRAGAT